MKSKDQLAQQTNLAFDFLERLYLEISFLIKEVEGMLAKEPEVFVIGRPSGYGITTRSSTGLDTNNVPLWLTRKVAVFFVPEGQTKTKSGQTVTNFEEQLKVIYLRIILNKPGLQEPIIYSGVLNNISKLTKKEEWPQKFEKVMGHFEYNEANMFKNPADIKYKDKYISLRGKLIENNLYDLNTAEEIYESVLKPALGLFRS
jgi:hypothetical protein